MKSKLLEEIYNSEQYKNLIGSVSEEEADKIKNVLNGFISKISVEIIEPLQKKAEDKDNINTLRTEIAKILIGNYSKKTNS